MPQLTRLATIPTKTSPQAEPPNTLLDIPLTPETFPLDNTLQPTTSKSAPDTPQPITPKGALESTLTPETLFFTNATQSTTPTRAPAGILPKIQPQTSLGVSLVP